MKIIVDSNVLVRAAVVDDPVQAESAQKILQEAELVVISPITLCEFYWVLSRGYKIAVSHVVDSILELVAVSNVRTNNLAVEAGVLFVDNGGEFADGVIWHLGLEMGGKTFVSFDKKAVKILQDQKESALLL